MWDPSRDEKALIADFLRGYDGAAAPALLEYIALIHDSAEKAGVYLNCGMDDASSYLRLSEFDSGLGTVCQGRPGRAGRPAVEPSRASGTHAPGPRMDQTLCGPKRRGCPERHCLYRPRGSCCRWPTSSSLLPNSMRGEFPRGNRSLLTPRVSRSRFTPTAAARPPKECQGLAAGEWMDIQDGEFALCHPGTWVTLVEDAKGSHRLCCPDACKP